MDGSLTAHLNPIWDPTIDALETSGPQRDHENPLLYTPTIQPKIIDWNITNGESFGVFILGAAYFLDIKLAALPGEVAKDTMALSGVGSSAGGARDLEENPSSGFTQRAERLIDEGNMARRDAG